MDLIIGYGEIGKAIGEVLTEAGLEFRYADLEVGNADIGPEYECMHICYPYSEYFVDDTCAYIKTFKPKMTVIHSTIAVGTTNKIKERLPDRVVAHSPVRGVHPHLKEGLLTFKKFVGSVNYENAKIVSNHLKEMNIDTVIVEDSNTTELAKLLSTSYYGLCILFNKEAKELSDRFGVDFNEVYVDWNETYNSGYEKLGMSNVRRPILKFMEGPIGGHCVTKNWEILKDDSELASIGLRLNDKYKPKGD